MAAWKKWILRRPAVSKKFKAYKGTVKNAKHLNIIVKKDSVLRKVISSIFSKKILVTTAVGSALGVGISAINEYIQSNSGCFLKSNNTVCKIKELSCCQPDAIENMPFCTGKLKGNPCVGFNEEKENTCCRLCDCQYYNCLANQTMECRRPSIGEALSFYSQKLTSGMWSFMLPFVYWMAGIVVTVLIILVGWKMYK